MTVVEGFDNGRVAAGSFNFCGAPLDSRDGGDCFPVGGLAPGQRIEVPNTVEQEPVMLLDKGFNGSPSKMLATANSDDVLGLSFTQPTNVVDFDLWSLNSQGTAQCEVRVKYVDANVPGTKSSAPASDRPRLRPRSRSARDQTSNHS